MSSPQSSIPPAGVPQSGNAKYAIVAILLLFAAGGLFAWKMLAGQPGPPPPQVLLMPSGSGSAQAATTHAFDDIPSAPPEEIKPEAGPQTRIVYVNTAGCDKTCSGSATSELSGAIQVRQQQARRCYNQALAADSTLKGRVSIALKVGGNGSACSASVASNDMGSNAVANCVATMFRNATYPAPKGGCLDVNVPMSFIAQGQ
jgi:hypothetical protein